MSTSASRGWGTNRRARGEGWKSGKETRVSGKKGMDRGRAQYMGMVVGKDG